MSIPKLNQQQWQRKLESNRREFWRDVGEGYKVLCYFSDAGDWAAILQTIATEIAGAITERGRLSRILDFGAGTGRPASAISNLLLTRFELRTSWTLVEPDSGARDCCRFLFSSEKNSPGGAAIYSSLPEVPTESPHDVALLMHSSYEVSDLDQSIQQLKSRLLGNGTILCLALPQDSPYFSIGRQTYGCSEHVQASLSKAGYSLTLYKLVSRIKILPEILENSNTLKALKAFANGDDLTDAEFIRMVRAHWRDETDFRDHLIVATPSKSNNEVSSIS